MIARASAIPEAPNRAAVVAEARVSSGTHTLSISLKEGGPTCDLVAEGKLTEYPTFWELGSVTGLAVVKGEGCQPQILVGPVSARSAATDVAFLEGAVWVKPTMTLDEDDARMYSELSPGLEDLNADGYLDFCGMIHPQADSPQICWLYDPARARFVRCPELDTIAGLRFGAKRLTGFVRSGSVLVGTEYQWLKGRFELVRRVTHSTGESMDGKPILGTFVRVEERRGNKLIKVSEAIETNP